MTKQVQNEGIYRSLVAQLDKVARHNRQGSFRTKDRYYEAMKRFCAFLADHFHLQKLANISGKHLVAYVLYLQLHSRSASTIKTDLSAIRFFHDKLDGTKYQLPDNHTLNVELARRSFGNVDRTWTEEELLRFIQICKERGHEDYAAIATLTYHVGLRIHECFRLDTAAVEAAQHTGRLTVKGKGGKVRSVPLDEEAKAVLNIMLARTERGHKLFVPDNVATDIAINRLQQFICSVRAEIKDPGSARPMTHHGLRHSFAARTYRGLAEHGATKLDASYQVSRLLGHERPDVTRIYLASLRKEESGSDD